MEKILKDFYKEMKKQDKNTNSFTDNFDNYLTNYTNSLMEDNSKKITKVISKKQKIEDPMAKYYFKKDILKENLSEQCNSIFYRMYLTATPESIDHFKKLKHCLKCFEIIFKAKRKEDEGYLSILQNFYKELVINFYENGEYDKALKIFEESINKEDFKLNVDKKKFYDFMVVIDMILDKYDDIMISSTNDYREETWNYDGFCEDQKKEFLLDNEFQDYSFTKPEKMKDKKIEKLANIAGEKELMKFKNEDKEENLEIVNEKEKTLIQTFHSQFGKDLLAINPSYYENLLVCFDYLENKFQTNDEIFGHLLNYLNENIEAVLFCIENRETLVEEIKNAKEALRQTGGKKQNQTYAKISQNLIITKKKKGVKNQKEGISATKDIFKILGIGDVFEEETKILQEKIIKKFTPQTEIDSEFDFFQTDFFKETDDSLKMKYGMKRKERLFNVVFDVEPKIKNILYKNTLKLKVSEIFPEHIKKAFTDSPELNNLQSIIFESCFNTDQNILCCAPTGAGKTNVALMTILRLAHKNFDFKTNTVLENFKVVYISPLKALATEIVKKFGKKLEYLGIKVKEFTGDVSLSKKDLASTHIIVSTPEKWDVVTRKSESLNSMLDLLIIDEIHLLDDVRGRVLESLVARTVRLIEAKQCRIRLLGLSATLPNYKDVAHFLKVGKQGLFFFDESFRPVPLYKKFIGVKKIDMRLFSAKQKQENPDISKGMTRADMMNQNAYDVCVDSLKHNKQVLVFVHSRKETIRFAEYLINKASEKAELGYFLSDKIKPASLSRRIENRDLKFIVQKGIGAHNAGIKRKDRHAIEDAFINGELQIVVCTATLAWGINMPCHTVIIKGTDFYDPGYGFKPMSLLDVQQIFGRAGRPQYDDYGEAVLITEVENLSYFISMLSYVRPIESNFKPFLNEGLLAEIVLGNISSLFEAIEFIKATFFYLRVLQNPTFYGFKDNNKELFLSELLRQHLSELHHLRLIRFDEMNDIIEATELGRIASHYYVNCQTMQKLCHYMDIYADSDNYSKLDDISEQNLFGIIAQATEFEQISAKPEEEPELNKLKKEFNWVSVDEHYKTLYDQEAQKEKAQCGFDSLDKVMLLIWGYLNKSNFETYSLVADTNYVLQNASRILRCLLDVALKQNTSLIVEKIIILMRNLENCVREFDTPLRMFCFDNYIKSVSAIRNQVHGLKRFNYIPHNACNKIEHAMEYQENGYMYSDIAILRENLNLLNDLNLSDHQIQMLTLGINAFPLLEVEFEAKPIAQTIMQINLKIKPVFNYNRQWHQKKEIFWVFCSDGNELLYHGTIAIDSTTANLSHLEEGMKTRKNNFIEHAFFVPLRYKSEMYEVKIMSERCVSADVYCDVDLTHVKIEQNRMEYTDLHDLRPLNTTILQNKQFEKLFTKLSYFNPIQTQVFWPLYHTDENVLIGAPTGSGKTIIAELAILRMFLHSPFKKIIYIAPYKALVKERVKDWKSRFGRILGKVVNELSGDYTPDMASLIKSDLLVATPEKWDGVSRNWGTRAYVKEVGLIIFDEIHLLGQDRGPTIEVIVSRMNYISRMSKKKTRMIGLSTAIANSDDVGKWFGVKDNYIFNFRPSIRPVPVDIHFRGFPEKNYAPRMNSMNKPCYQDIKKFGNNLPVLVFVSSRKQTRLTALDLISLSSNDFVNKSPFMKMTFDELEMVLQNVSDKNLKHFLNFGIGIHHAGLGQSDRMIVEELFESSKIQILIATSTLAWGVNFPAKLVIIKGTVFYDPKLHTYVDMPISDILQMVGRAGRPQYNDKGTACVYVEKEKKNFYRKYLNDPFPIESAFLTQIVEQINAEISGLSIKNKQACVDYLTWTYFFRRIIRNPVFYGLPNKNPETIQKFLIDLVDKTFKELKDFGCLEIDEDNYNVTPKLLGELACNYYLKCKTVFKFEIKLERNLSIEKLLKIISEAEEYQDVPVRHHEAEMNVRLSELCPYKINKSKADSPNVKTFLLLQAYFSNLPLPIRDYISDTNTILDSSFRIIAAMIDLSAEKNFFRVCMNLIHLLQMIVQGCWINHSGLQNIPHFNDEVINELRSNGVSYLAELIDWCKNCGLKELLRNLQSKKFSEKQIDEINSNVNRIPDVDFDVKLFKFNSESFKVEKLQYQFRGGEEAMLEVNLFRKNFENDLIVENKKLNKYKTYSWWLLVGNIKMDKIYAIKKFIFTKKNTKNIQIDIPLFSKPSDYDLEVYLMSDSYIGIDQIKIINLKNYITPIYNGIK